MITLYAAVLLCVVLNLIAEYSRDIMMMQQNSYRNDRYLRWLRTSGDTTSYPRLIGLCVGLFALANFSSQMWGMLITGIFGACNAWHLFTRKYKKPLVWTKRVKRIFAAMLLLSLIITVVVAVLSVNEDGWGMIYFSSAVTWTFLYCASQIVTMASIVILSPVEKVINKGYYDDAARILKSVPGLTVIGVTGSYGKTSTKHYLERILSETYEVLMTPGSFNTTMGVIRTVREMMKPYTEVFICEMGAKQLNDIKEICDLVHPRIGIVTAVGPQHLESFKTIENVQRTKFELVDSLPSDGLAVINNDFPYIANRKVENVAAVRYGVADIKGTEFYAEDITYSPDGTTFTIVGPERHLTLHTRLVGECNVSNLVAAVIVALYMEVPEEKIRYAVDKISQVEHRLNIKRAPGGLTIIDDAYNSNPTGSGMALDVLASMTGGKRIVITPGMIELGDEQYNLNREFGKKIAKSVDVAIVVGDYNRVAIVEGIESVADSAAQLITVATFAEAQHKLIEMAKAGDTVLYENDLPDTFK